VAGITAASYSEFASIYSENGGGYLFNSRTFTDRRLLTYGVGASLFLGYTGTTAFYLATMDEWFVRFIIPESLQWLPHGAVGAVTAVLLGVLNARGTEESGTFQLFVTGAKVAVLAAFVSGAFAFRGPARATANFTSQFQADAVGIVTVAALAFITFFGFSAIAASAGEIIEPRKTVPRAIAASIVTVTILYALVIVAMTNSTVPPQVVAEEGETAMGLVAEGFLGSIGRSLIVAGAVFSMVSASNASILAATGIGSLMGRRGQAPRPFTRIHSEYGTPFWSVAAVTATVVVLIVAFIGVFPSEGGLLGLDLGLTALTGFATLNLLLPLSVVNAALIVHRRKFPDIERGFRVPGVPVVPALGILANLALIYNLPFRGVVTGVVLIVSLLAAYLAWGGAPEAEDLYREVAPTAEAGAAVGEPAAEARPAGGQSAEAGPPDGVGGPESPGCGRRTDGATRGEALPRPRAGRAPRAGGRPGPAGVAARAGTGPGTARDGAERHRGSRPDATRDDGRHGQRALRPHRGPPGGRRRGRGLRRDGPQLPGRRLRRRADRAQRRRGPRVDGLPGGASGHQ
jgi:amino acid transporter